MNGKKLRTVTQLAEYIHQDLSWRKFELIEAKRFLEQSSLLNPQRDFLLRSSIIILYAHWEGFIKNAATAYIGFVIMRKLTYAEIKTNFVAMALDRKIRDATGAKTISTKIALIDFVLSELSTRVYFPWEEAINTEANLSSTVFREIVSSLGLDYLPEYETKQNLIDKTLLKNRNSAAHGEQYVNLDMESFIQLYYTMLGDVQENRLGLFDIFGNQIINAAQIKTYKRN